MHQNLENSVFSVLKPVAQFDTKRKSWKHILILEHQKDMGHGL